MSSSFGRRSSIRVASWPARRNRAKNPFQALLSEELEARGDITVVEFEPLKSWRRGEMIWHWHWPENQLSGHGRGESFARALLMLMNILAARVRRIRIVLTVHNLDPHRAGQGAFGELTLRVVRRSASGFHFLSESSRSEFLARHPWAATRALVTTQHGRYFPQPAGVSQSEARAQFGLDPSIPTVAFIGQMDDYKRVDQLCHAMLQLNGRAQLLIVGRISPGCSYEPFLRSAATENRTIELREGWASDETIAHALQAADLIALPYERITNSGSAILALSAGRAVIAPALGAIPELAELVGEDWVSTYTDAISAEAISTALSNLRGGRRSPDLQGLSWKLVASELDGFYRKLSRR